MATFIERSTRDGKKSVYVKIRLRGHPPQSATFDGLTKARKWASSVETAMREGRHFKTTEAKRHTLAKLVDRYIADILPRKPKSYTTQKIQLLWWQTQLGAYTLADITPALIVECRERLIKETTQYKRLRAPATANRYLAILSHAFTIAMKEWGWVEDSPFRKISKIRESRGRVRFLSDEEREKLLTACRESTNPFLHLIVVLCLSTGGRKTEILSLPWKQVDLHRKVIVLEETKNGERRVLPLMGLAHQLMQQHGKVRPINSTLVFPGQNPQKPIDIKTAWQNALQRAAITDFRFHDLRHSAASYLAMNGASLAEIADVLGHKTLSMVKRYAHLSEAHTAGVVEKMNAKIFG